MLENSSCNSLLTVRSKSLGPIEVSKVSAQSLEKVHNAELLVEGEDAASLSTFEERLATYPEGFLYAMSKSGDVLGYLEAYRWKTDTKEIHKEVADYTSVHDPLGENMYIFLVATVPSFRREGVASSLVRGIQRVAESSDMHSVQLATRPYLAKSLYEPLGFRTSHQASDFYQNDSHTVMDWLVDS